MQRILRGTAATLSYVNLDTEGSPAAANGAVTVRVVRADGTEVLPAGTATTAGTGTGEFSVSLTPAQTALLDELTVTWTDSDSSHTTKAEVVGGFYFSVGEARASDSTLENAGKYPDADILAARAEVEQEFEEITGVAFVPRYHRILLSGSGKTSQRIPSRRIRAIRSVEVDGVAWTTSDVASVRFVGNVLARADGGFFPVGVRNIVVAYEHGWDRPPADVRRAALLRLRSLLNANKTGIPDRATSFTVTEGGTYRLATAGKDRTGIDSVDAVLARYSEQDTGVGSLIVGRV